MVGGIFGKLATVISLGFQTFTGYRRPGALLTGAFIAMATMVALLAWTPEAGAYGQYTPAKGGQDGCAACHGDFNNNAGYVSLQDADAAAWPTDTMNSHNTDMLQGVCASCHGAGAKFPVLMGSSNDTVLNTSCMGCHGRVEDANTVAPSNGPGYGAGLRQVHFLANRNVTRVDGIAGTINTQVCADCHGDSNPANFTSAAENTVPAYYTNTTINVTPPTDPCTAETLYGTLGLDNDGDGLIDTNDADCQTNAIPVADLSATILGTVTVGSPVTLNASNSTDGGDGGQTLTYTFSLTGKPVESGLTLGTTPFTPGVNPWEASFTPDRNGNYEVTLTVFDGFDNNDAVADLNDVLTVSTVNNAPTADAGGPYAAVNGQTVTLNGGGSGDTDGDLPLTYAWTLTNQPVGSTATLLNANTASPSFTIDVSGGYEATLVVTDSLGLDSTASIATISTTNTPPTAAIVQTNTAFVEQIVNLDASTTSDPDVTNGPQALTYTWSFNSVPTIGGGAPADSTLLDTDITQSPASPLASFTPDVAGSYIVQLVVGDGVTTDTVTHTVTTNNTAPVANAGPDQSVAVNDVVTLNGTGSTDVDGDPLTYSWSLTSGPDIPTLNTTSPALPTFTATSAGDYIWSLTVNDGLLTSTADQVTIAAGSTNVKPVANAGLDQSGVNGATITLNGGGSSDANGDTLNYSWSITAKPATSGATLVGALTATPSFVIDVSGLYTVQLIVNDGSLNSDPDSVNITTDNTPPVANAGGAQSVVVGQTVTLDGSVSNDVDNDPLTYSWSFNSVPLNSGLTTLDIVQSGLADDFNATFVPDEQGDYIVQLIVNDGTVNSTAPSTVTITTNNSAPTANAGLDQPSVPLGGTVTLDGSGSIDPDGDALSYAWSISSKPLSSTAALTGATTVSPTFVADLKGNYVVQLIVTDDAPIPQSSVADTMTATVANATPVANAGPDQSIVDGGLVTLDGNGSNDADTGDTLTYSWALTARPTGSTAALSATNIVGPTFTADVAGTYTARLIVNDGTVNSTADFVNVVNTSSVSVPNIVLSPTTLDFGSAIVGTTQTGYVAVQNDGETILNVSGLALSGLDAADFAIVGPALPFGVSVGRQTLVEVSYTPTAAAADNAALDITNDDPDTPTASATLIGTGISAVQDINLPSTALVFGDAEVGSTLSGIVVIQNLGTADLNVTGLSFTGSADFALPAGAPTTYVVEPDRQVSVQVDYTPGEVGPDAGSLTVASDDPVTPSLAVSLDGNGVAASGTPTIDTTPSVAFGDVLVGATKRQFMYIRNVGTADLEVTSLALTGSADFTLFNPPTPPFTIRPDRQVSFKVEYTATAGPVTGSVVIGSDDLASPSVSVPVTGNGVGGTQVLNLPTTSVAYGDVLVGASQRAFVAVQNTGTVDLLVNSLTMSGSADFALVNPPVGSFILRPGRQVSLKVDFTPSAAGPVTGALAVNSDAPVSPIQSVSFSGSGVGGAPTVVLSTSSVNYGDVEVGNTQTASLAIQNTGTGPLNVTGLAVTGSADLALPAGAPTSYVVEPGRQVIVQVNYTPGELGLDTGALGFTSDAPGSPHSVSLDGNGIAIVGSPVVNLPTPSVDFGNVLVGTSESVYVAIQNQGTADLNVTGLGTTGSADFALPVGTPTSYVIAPGRQASVRVIYTPGAAGLDSGSLAFTSDAAGSPHSVSLSGNGEAGVADINLQASYDYGDVVVGTTNIAYIAIQNLGTGDLTVTNLTLTGSADIALAAGTPTTYVIPAGRQVVVQVEYTPSATGIVSTTMTVTSDDGATPSVTSTLSGNGVPAV